MGLFDALSGETLTWRPFGDGDAVAAGEPESRPTQSFYRLEKSLGEQPVGWNGFLITVAAGGAVGGVLGGTLWEEDWLFDSGDLVFVGAILGIAASIPVGILVSQLVKVEKWAPVDVRGSGPRLELRPLPSGRFGLGVSLPTGR
ncbi:MAG: hypothetical protein LJF04_06135 [Gemmatimonadetes bacterium]|nr:hypothetical protein [Gemmatimonadota bacterium]